MRNRSAGMAAACALVILIADVAQANDYYISSSEGRDTSSGATPAQALQTLERLNLIGLKTGDRVYLRRGDTLRGTLNIKAGNNDISFDGYGSGLNRPTISGAARISNWTLHSGKIYRAAAASHIYALYIEGKEMLCARYPDSGFQFIPNAVKEGKILSDPALTQASGHWTGARLRLRTLDYAYDTFSIASYSPGALTLGRNCTVGKGRNYYIDNKLEALDAPGEWYYDPVGKAVYLYPPAGTDLTRAVVEGSSFDYGIKADWNARRISVSNLKFTYQRLEAVWLAGECDGITVRNCEFVGTLTSGMYIMGNNAVVESCVVHDGHGHGMLLQSLRGNSRVRANRIYRHGLTPGYSASPDGIHLINSTGAVVSENHLDSLGYVGIFFAGGSGNIIQRNVISKAMLNLSDGGGIYTCCAQTTGATIKENFVYDLPGDINGVPGGIVNAIYVDNNATGVTVRWNATRLYGQATMVSVSMHRPTMIPFGATFVTGIAAAILSLPIGIRRPSPVVVSLGIVAMPFTRAPLP